MSVTRAELKGRILRVLNKDPGNQGFYTDNKIHDAIQEAVDQVATEMMMADEGWLSHVKYLDTTPNLITLPVPPYMSMIKEVRYLIGNIYSRLNYDDDTEQDQWQPGSGVTQYAFKYRIIDNRFYFNPVLAEGGPAYLQIEYMSFPRVLQDDNDLLDTQFNNAMEHFIKYRAATILQASFGKYQVEWAALEAQWYTKILGIINKRNMQSTAIREFSGV